MGVVEVVDCDGCAGVVDCDGVCSVAEDAGGFDGVKILGTSSEGAVPKAANVGTIHN